MLVAQVPTVLRTDLYAVPALVAAAITVAAIRGDVCGAATAVAAACRCLVIIAQVRHLGGDNSTVRRAG